MPAGMGTKNFHRAYVSDSIFEKTYARANELSSLGTLWITNIHVCNDREHKKMQKS
jgi:hypothetical protein